MESSVQRKLAAILMADVKGYSRLMGTDEEATLHQLREYQEITRRLIEEHHGRLVDAPGDALLADFGSVVEAVRCAVEVQKELSQRNAELPVDRRMDLRMGINLGDVIVDGDSLYGDGVNIAARLEPLANAGGVCISGSVYDNVKNKLQFQWESLGEQNLKNIAEPIRAYRLSPTAKTETTEVTPGQPLSTLAPAYTEATTTGSHPLVGRHEELSFLRERVDAISQGQGSVVFLAGEAGIGKTRLAREARDYALNTGCQWFEGKYEKAVSQPYKAWSDVLRGYIRQSGSPPPDIVASPYAAYLQKIVPEVAPQPNGATKTASQIDPESERFELFDSVTQFLIRVSREAPLVLFIDDVQWSSSIEILQYLARNIGNQQILILAAYREEEVKENTGVWNTVLAMNRERLFYSLSLRPLDERDVSQLMSHTVDKSMAPELVDVIFKRTRGNPFFVEEMMHFLWERGSIVATDKGWNVAEAASLKTPDSVKAVINERLVELGTEAEELLRVASVIGREFPLQVLRELVDQEEEEMIELIDRCEDSGLIVTTQSPGEEVYAFVHDLLQEALYESIGSGRRRRNHLRIGQAIEKVYPKRLDEWYDSLARHFMEGNDLQKTVKYSECAAQRSMDSYSYNGAVRLLEQALKAQAIVDPNDQAKRCDQLLALGRALGPAGDAKRVAEAVAPEALGFAEGLGDRERASDCCQMALEALYRYGGNAITRSPLWQQWAERASSYAAPGTADRVRSDLALHLVYNTQHRWAETNRVLRQANKLARKLDNPQLLFEDAYWQLRAGAPANHQLRRLTLAEEFSDVSREGVSERTLFTMLVRSQSVLMAGGRRNRAEQLWQELDRLAARTHDAGILIWPLLREGLLANLDGDLEHAAELRSRISTRADELGVSAAGRLFGEHIAMRPLLNLGRAEEELGYLPEAERLAGSKAFSSTARYAWGTLCLAHMGRTTEAQAQLRKHLEELNLSRDEDETPGTMLVTLLECAVLIKDREAVSLLAGRLKGHVAIATSDLFLVNVGRNLGQAAVLLENREDARANYARALDWATSIRYRPEIALTRFELAELLFADAEDGTEADSSELRSEVQAHLDFVIDEFRAMKMQPALDRAVLLKNSLG